MLFPSAKSPHLIQLRLTIVQELKNTSFFFFSTTDGNKRINKNIKTKKSKKEEQNLPMGGLKPHS